MSDHNTLRALELAFNGQEIPDERGQHMRIAARRCCNVGWMKCAGDGDYRLTDFGRTELIRRAPWYAHLTPMHVRVTA